MTIAQSSPNNQTFISGALGVQRFTAQAGRIFLGIAVVVLVFSFFPLVGMPLMTDSVKVVLAVMHIVAAGAIMGAFALRQR